MKYRELGLAWAIAACLGNFVPVAGAADGGTHPMADAMTRMMDAFGLIDRYRWNTVPPQTGRPPTHDDTPGQGGFWSGAQPRVPVDVTRDSPLEGVWQAASGGVMVVRQGLVRLYASAELHQDFYLKLHDQRLLLRDARSGQVNGYDMALQGDRLVLRDRAGNLLLFRRTSAGRP